MKDVLGETPPKDVPQGQKDPTYSHWCKPEPRAGGDFDLEDRRFDSGKGGMSGETNPKVPVTERERGDSKAPSREPTFFEGQDFDINQYDRKE